jgi:hypothetical protein
MKTKYIFLSTLITALVICLLVSCTLEPEKTSQENMIIVVDSASNKAMSLYETDGQDRIVRTQTLMPDGNIRRLRDYAYNDEGYLSRMIERNPAKGVRTVYYDYEVEKDGEGRVERLITTDSEGTRMEYRYGYDQYGTLRQSAAQINGGDAALFKEYSE